MDIVKFSADMQEQVNDFFKQCFLKRRHTIFFKR